MLVNLSDLPSNLSDVTSVITFFVLIVLTFLLVSLYRIIQFRGYLVLLFGNISWVTSLFLLNINFALWTICRLSTICLYTLGIYFIYVAQVKAKRVLIVKGKELEVILIEKERANARKSMDDAQENLDEAHKNVEDAKKKIKMTGE